MQTNTHTQDKSADEQPYGLAIALIGVFPIVAPLILALIISNHDQIPFLKVLPTCFAGTTMVHAMFVSAKWPVVAMIELACAAGLYFVAP